MGFYFRYIFNIHIMGGEVGNTNVSFSRPFKCLRKIFKWLRKILDLKETSVVGQEGKSPTEV